MAPAGAITLVPSHLSQNTAILLEIVYVVDFIYCEAPGS